ncbi:siroheme synthase [Klebsiella pneumoniae]|nr:siroheme synthase [Klebsiella pneumoniae]
MDYLPLFAELKQRPVLVIGGGEIAERKIKFLLRAQAQVQVVAETLSPALADLAARQALSWRATAFSDSLVDDVFLVIAATEDEALNQRVFAAANARYRLVNVVDNQALCSFVFPSIVDRSPLLVAISSSGKAPVLSRILREKIEALLPTNLGRLAESASYWRNHLKTRLTTTEARRRFWERVFTGRFASLMVAGNSAEAEKALQDELDKPERETGEIILVGAGPGDAGLLTLRGLQAIQQADVVFHDHLVTQPVLELVRRDAELICVGKRAGEHSVPQHETNQLLVAISSSGKAPVLSRILREKIEALLPTNLGRLAESASYWRNHLKTRLTTTEARRRFWERVFTGRFASLMVAGNSAEAEKALQDELDKPERETGEIILVGAGPGDAGLLTLRGLQAIQQADVVFHDHLVTQPVLELVRRDAELICVGKRAGEHSVPQHETNQLLVEAAKAGKTVVRLKGGDPFIFGRGAEELQAAAEAGIPFQVVPGVTAAAGATAYAGIPLTHRDYAQSAVFVTGHYKPDSAPFDWSLLAKSQQTLAIYMGTMKAAEISAQLIAHGRDSDTPVAVISRGTRDDQQTITGTLQQLEHLAKDAPMPALLVVGEVVQLHQQLAWFQHTSSAEGFNASVVNLA